MHNSFGKQKFLIEKIIDRHILVVLFHSVLLIFVVVTKIQRKE